MLQYLLNLTAIWLISLVVFDLLLKKESFHNYNRFYLLATFFAGLLIPLWHWEENTHIVHTMLQQPMAKLIANNHDIETTAAQINSAQGFNLLWSIYIAGALVATGILIANIIKLAIFYKHGRKSKGNGWVIVETHKEHAPFSFLNVLFISSRKLYDMNEWAMLLTHEQQHAHLLHFADIALLQLSRVVLWFHPLVYIYHNRICLVHEYQADTACKQPPKVYGKFLVNQMLLQAAPSVTHALSNAPVKKRIKMLTHRSPRYRQLAQLSVLPLIALFMVCFTRYDIEYQQDRSVAVNNNISQTQPYSPYPGSFTQQQCAPAADIPQPCEQTCKRKEKKLMAMDAPSMPDGGEKYLSYNDAMTLLPGMENNGNAKCCSSNLLWGSSYSGILSQGYASYNPVLMAEYTGNACTQGFDQYRKEQYIHTVESYKHVQASWNDYAANGNTFTIVGIPKTTQIVIADDPWNVHTDKSPGMVPPLSIDRAMFGPNVKSIFDDAIALSIPVKAEAPSASELLSLATPASDQKIITLKSKGTRTKNTPYTP